MQVAHTLGTGGPEIELLIVAAAMLVLGVIFFVQKTVKSVVSVVLIVGAFALGAGAFAVGGSDTAGSAGDLTVAIAAPEDGAVVPARTPVLIEIDLQAGEAELEGGSHFDVRVDEQLETMTPEPNPEILFEPGEHIVAVEFVDSRHQSFDPPVRDEITITAE